MVLCVYSSREVTLLHCPDRNIFSFPILDNSLFFREGLQWAEDCRCLVGFSQGFEAHWRSLSMAKFIEITKLSCLGHQCLL